MELVLQVIDRVSNKEVASFEGTTRCECLHLMEAETGDKYFADYLLKWNQPENLEYPIRNKKTDEIIKVNFWCDCEEKACAVLERLYGATHWICHYLASETKHPEAICV